MNKIVLIISILFLATSLKGQVSLLDSVTNEPIVGANVYSSDGLLLGVSDINGIMGKSILNTPSPDKILIQHVSYNNKEISFQTWNQSRTILLTPRTIQLDSVVVKTKNNYDYVVLKGYFRTYDLSNNKPKYFYDGIIEFYIPLKNGKKVYHKLLAYRLFANQEALNEFVQLFGKKFLDSPKIFPLKQESYMNYLPKDYELIDTGDKIAIMRNGLSMGFVQKTKAGNTQLYFDKVPPQSKISRSLFGIKGEQYRGLILENYAGTNIKNPSLANLISRIRSTVGAVQRKKGNGFIPMETFEEFYVLDRTYLLKNDVDRLKNTFKKSIWLDEKSSYSENFWTDLDRYGIPPLPSHISKQLNGSLKEK